MYFFSKTSHLRIILLFFSIQAIGYSGFAQNPAPYDAGVKVNFLRTWKASAPENNANSLLTRPLTDVQQSTQYMDGLGRPIQTVIKKASQPTGSQASDWVEAKDYDLNGREPYQYLPFAANSTGINPSDGNFKLNPFQQQLSFFNQVLTGQNETAFYSKTTFESSPLGQPVKVYSPGSNYVNANRFAEQKYLGNVLFGAATENDDIRIWQINADGSYDGSALYEVGQLLKEVTIDEERKVQIVYKDKEGKVILEKILLNGSADAMPITAYDSWLCTYYVYDDLNRLRCVISPKAVQLLSSPGQNWQLTSDILNELCEYYLYDDRGRMIIKKTAGAGEERMVYDKWDRLVLTQDGNLRANNVNKWIFTKYDQYNRIIATGFYTNHIYTTQESMQGHLDILNLARFENYNPANMPLYSLNLTFPAAVIGDILQFTYYDDYSWSQWHGPNWNIKDNSYDAYCLPVTTSYPYAQPLTQSNNIVGLVTGVWQPNFSGGLLKVNFYDEKARIIQTKSYNQSQGQDIRTIQYSFDDKVLIEVLKQQKLGDNSQTHIVVTKMNYDDLGRVKEITKAVHSVINGVNVSKPEQLISTYAYNARGQVKSKTLGANNLQTLVYDYNLNGQLKNINKEYLTGNDDKYFALELGYDKTTSVVQSAGFINPKYDGNISGNIWKTRGAGFPRKYDYQYDNASRLIKADFIQNSQGNVWGDPGLYSVDAFPDFNNQIPYDANGNILAIRQYALKANGPGTIDGLRYEYFTNSNKLKKIFDESDDPNFNAGDFKNGVNGGDDYAYDANGNLIMDLNRGITSIIYNHLNLPLQITFGSRGYIQYVYDYAGQKLKKIIHEDGKADRIILYMENMVYLNNVLQFIGHEEGKLRMTPAYLNSPIKYDHDYFIKDHQDNTRVILTEEEALDTYVPLNFEGANATEVGDQNSQWEKADGSVFDVIGLRTTRPQYFGDDLQNGTYAILARKTTGAVGAAKLLKVMSGDRIHTRLEYFYQVANADNSPANGLSTLVSTIAQSLSYSNAATEFLKIQSLQIASNLGSDGFLGALLNTPANTNSGNVAPKAYLNVLFFDEQFKLDASNSFSYPVAYLTSNQKGIFDKTYSNALEAKKNGYVYLYFSNETNEMVYFDNFFVSQEHGPLLEETHYYPMGLTMRAISGRAIRNLYDANKFKYQGQELESSLGLEMYEFEARQYDPQIGRWNVPDPAGQFASPYAAMANNWTQGTDPDGRFFGPIVVGAMIGAYFGGIKSDMKGGSFLDGAWRGALVGGIGGALGNVSSGTFLAQVAWGTFNGASTGALSAALFKENIGQGALIGGISGALFSSTMAGIESFRNYKDGFAFGTNDGNLKRMFNDLKSSLPAGSEFSLSENWLKLDAATYKLTNFKEDAQKIVDFFKLRYGGPGAHVVDFTTIDRGDGPEPSFDPITTISRGKPMIRMPMSSFYKSNSYFKYAMSHEYGHYFNDIVYDANGVAIDVIQKNTHIMGRDGTSGLFYAIRNSGKYHYGLQPLRSSNFPLHPEAWKAYGPKKWLNLIPRRF